MKSALIFSIFLLLMGSCKSLELTSLWDIPNKPIPVKLLPLEKQGFNSDKFLINHVDKNICEPWGEKYGYLVCLSKIETQEKGFFLSYWGGLLTLGTTWILGVPFCVYNTNAELDFEILNNKSERIAKFSSSVKARVPAALYYGYNPTNAGYKCEFDAVNLALEEIRTSLSKEMVDEINAKLRESGKLHLINKSQESK
jgi:hypothetical protein